MSRSLTRLWVHSGAPSLTRYELPIPPSQKMFFLMPVCWDYSTQVYWGSCLVLWYIHYSKPFAAEYFSYALVGPLQKVRLCRKHCEAYSRRSLIIVLRHCCTMIAAIDSELRGTLGGWRMICCNIADDCWDFGASISIADILCRPNADNLGYFITCVCSPKT